MHIPDDDERFLADFDSQMYVDLLERAKVDTAMIYTSSCLGICNWPSPVGPMHRGLKDRDIVGELIEKCHEKGMNVLLYLNFWSTWAYNEHPEWRFINARGEGTAEYLWDIGRFGVCCPNSPYSDFVIEQVEDLCRRYEFEGIWIDMLTWPYSVCYCSYCRQRYLKESRMELPKKVDWHNPGWVGFQRSRERWLAEFAGRITSTVRRMKPSASVGHQCAFWFLGWNNGLTNAFFQETDYVSGDFNGTPLEQTFTCKVFYHLSENKPFEYMTSRCINLKDHTTMKSKDLMRAKMFSTVANGGAFLFIDAIDPVGTMDRHVYEQMGELYSEMQSYEPFLSIEAVPCQDAAIYLNFESEIDLSESGKHVTDTSITKPIIKRAMNAAKALMDANIPFAVITNKNLQELSTYQVIILPDLAMVDEDEADAFRQFVHNGGSVYASRNTSLYAKEGKRLDDFLLADLFGVTFVGETAESVTYFAPTEQGASVFGPIFSSKYPLTLPYTQNLVKIRGGSEVEVLATLTLPFTVPGNPKYFASAISNPPGVPTDNPAITLNRFGQGKAVYATGDFEGVDTDVHREVFACLIRSLQTKPFHFDSDAPKPVEVTMFRDDSNTRYLIHLMNFQEEMPNVPVEGTRIRVRLDGRIPSSLTVEPKGNPIKYTINGDMVEFTAPKLDTYMMLQLRYQ